MSTDVPRSADITIIGGGVIGVSIAFHLARRNAGSVLVLERNSIGSGATAHATGGIRQQFSTPANILLSRESVRFFEEFEDRVGYPLLYRQIGYLFLISDENQLHQFERNARLQNELNVPTEIIDPAEIKRRHPVIEVGDLIGASFCATDGSAAPADAAYAFSSVCRDLGVAILEEVEVTGIEMDGGRVRGVVTSAGTVATECVINAAGPWATQIAEMIGLELPISPHPRQVFTVTPVEDLGPAFPFVVDMNTGVYIHQEPGSILLGGGDREREASFEPMLEWSHFDYVVDAITHRVPVMENAGSITGWCGLREMTPDDHPIMGPVDDCEGFWIASGFSGHGFMHAPAAGRIMSEWILDDSPSDTDVSPFLASRFSGAVVTEEQTVF